MQELDEELGLPCTWVERNKRQWRLMQKKKIKKIESHKKRILETGGDSSPRYLRRIRATPDPWSTRPLKAFVMSITPSTIAFMDLVEKWRRKCLTTHFK